MAFAILSMSSPCDKKYVHKGRKETTHEEVGEEGCKHKITPRCVIEEEIEELGEKTICHPLSDKLIH